MSKRATELCNRCKDLDEQIRKMDYDRKEQDLEVVARICSEVKATGRASRDRRSTVDAIDDRVARILSGGEGRLEQEPPF